MRFIILLVLALFITACETTSNTPKESESIVFQGVDGWLHQVKIFGTPLMVILIISYQKLKAI